MVTVNELDCGPEDKELQVIAIFGFGNGGQQAYLVLMVRSLQSFGHILHVLIQYLSSYSLVPFSSSAFLLLEIS